MRSSFCTLIFLGFSKALVLLTVVAIAISCTRQATDNQAVLYKISEIKSNYYKDSGFRAVKEQIDKLTDIDEKLSGYNEKVLFMASTLAASNSDAVEKKLQLMEYVLEKGANPNIFNQTAQIPPLYQVEEAEGFDLLVRYGADVNFHSDFGHIFSTVSTFERVKKVISLGFDVDSNQPGYAALYVHIFLTGMDSDTLDFLLKKYPDLAVEYDNLGWNFTHYASSGRRIDLLEILLEHGTDLTLKTKTENEGYYGYDNGIKKGSTVIDIIEQLQPRYIAENGEKATKEIIEKVLALKSAAN